MELIATAQFRRAMDRALDAAAYTDRLSSLVRDIAEAGWQRPHPLLESREDPKRTALLVLTGNQGMCGGYNSGVLRIGVQRYREAQDRFPEVELDVSGRKGIAALRFRGFRLNRTFTKFEDKPRFDEVRELAEDYLREYLAGRLDRLDVVYTKFESLGRQWPAMETVLPLMPPTVEDEAPRRETEYEFLPSARSILEEIVPMSFRVRLFKCFLDAAVSEQVARMVAMKAATENADQMSRILSMKYNRTRQSQITAELLEIVGGADALEH